jgi:hypothetical protein
MATEWLRQEGGMYKLLQTFSSVAASGSLARTAIPLATFGGRLVQVTCTTGNVVEFDFSLYQHATSLKNTSDEIYRAVSIQQQWTDDAGLEARFTNVDSPPTLNLYIELDNLNAIIPTGTITLTIWIKAPGQGVV